MVVSHIPTLTAYVKDMHQMIGVYQCIGVHFRLLHQLYSILYLYYTTFVLLCQVICENLFEHFCKCHTGVRVFFTLITVECK